MITGSENKFGSSGNLELGLVVVGKAINCLGILLEGFAELMEPDSAEIIMVSASGYQGEDICLGDCTDAANADNLPVLSADVIIENFPWECNEIGLQLLSPLRLLANGRQCSNFNFSLFARSLLRRVSSLAYYYADYKFDADFRRLSEIAGAVRCTVDDFSSESVKRSISGITGSGSFKGDFSELLPFLVLGSYLNAGKGAAYGMGKYKLMV